MLKPNRRVLTHSQSSQEQTTPGTCGDESIVKIAPASELSVITQLSELQLTAFIQCSCYEKYEVLAKAPKPEYSDEEKAFLVVAWQKLLYQYYDSKEDKIALQYLDLDIQLRSIIFRAQWIGFMTDSIQKVYNDSIASVLREEFPRLKFTRESCAQDIKSVFNMERQYKMRHDQIKNQIAQIEANRDKREYSPEQKERNFYDSLIGINSILKSSYEIKKLSALEYTRLSKAADDLLASQKKTAD